MAGRENTKSNGKAYAVALDITNALKRGGFIEKTTGVRQFLFDNFKDILGGGHEASGAEFGAEVQKWMDSPMTPDEEAKSLRAILHAGLSKGNIPPQLLDKLDKIIGVSSGEDETIQVVDWSTAFPDIETAVLECREMLNKFSE